MEKFKTAYEFFCYNALVMTEGNPLVAMELMEERQRIKENTKEMEIIR